MEQAGWFFRSLGSSSCSRSHCTPPHACCARTPAVPEEECIATIHKAVELGCCFLDTSDIYGDGANEELISGCRSNEPMALREYAATVQRDVM